MSTELTVMRAGDPDFDAVAMMHLDGQLHDEARERFCTLIMTDPRLAKRLAEIAEMHAALGEYGRTTMSQDRPVGTTSASSRPSRRGRRVGEAALAPHPRNRWGMWSGAAAALVILGVILGLALPSVMATPTGIPTMLTAKGGSLSLERDGVLVHVGDQPIMLAAGDRLLTDPGGRAEINTGRGDRLLVSGGARLKWNDGTPAVDLTTGAFTADIARRHRLEPFVVRTPTADLVVLGTRFTVQADDGLSLLAVDHGAVRLTNRYDSRQVDVTANHHAVTTGAGDLVPKAGPLPSADSTGLTGDYFDDEGFTSWRFRRTDPTIDFNWERRGPGGEVRSETFSVRWRGWLVPTVSGPCTFTFYMDDGVRLWLDGTLVFDHWHLSEKLEFSTTVTLQAGRAYAVRLDYFQRPAEALLTWYWSNAEHPKQVVPTSWLRPLDWTPPAP